MLTLAAKRSAALAKLADADVDAMLTNLATVDAILADLNDVGAPAGLPADERDEQPERWDGMA